MCGVNKLQLATVTLNRTSKQCNSWFQRRTSINRNYDGYPIVHKERCNSLFFFFWLFFSFVSIADDWPKPAIRGTVRFLQIVIVSYPLHQLFTIQKFITYCMLRTTFVTFDLAPKRWPTCLSVALGWELKTKEMSKLRSITLLFVYCASSECINDKGSVVHYYHVHTYVKGLSNWFCPSVSLSVSPVKNF